MSTIDIVVLMTLMMLGVIVVVGYAFALIMLAKADEAKIKAENKV